MKRLIVSCLLFPLAFMATAADDTAATESALPTLFVAPLDGDRSAIMAWQPALGEGLAEMLITELSKLKHIQVLESTALPELIDEIRLGESGFVGDAERVEKGGFTGADFMFRGKVTRFGNKATDTGLKGFVPRSFGNLGLKTTTADVRIDWRLVDVFNRKVIESGSATASEKGVGFDIGVSVKGHGGKIGHSNKEFMNSALGKATVKAVETIGQNMAAVRLPESGRRRSKATAADKQAAQAEAMADTLRKTPGKVLAVVNPTSVIVSLGSQHGFKAGDKLKAYETTEIKDDKGAVVFTEEKFAGDITLETVQEERSKAVYSGTAAIKSGWTIKAD